MKTAPFDHRAPTAFVIALVTMAASGIGFQALIGALQVFLHKEPVELRLPFSVTIPRTLGEWKAEGEDGRFAKELEEELGTEQYLDRLYITGKGRDRRALRVHIAYYTGMIDAVPHVPDRCFVAGGMVPGTVPANHPIDLGLTPGADHEVAHPVTRAVETVRVPTGEYALRTTPYGDPGRPDDVLFAGYFFVANHHVTPNPRYIKGLAFKPSIRKAYYAKFQFTMVGSQGSEPGEFLQLSTDLLKHLFPHALRSLPDSQEFEAPDDA